ncbi:MAG: AAA family ATPase, partial [Betaproteobacteria bacterium]
MAKKTRTGSDDDAESNGGDDLGLVNGSQVKVEKIAWAWPGMVVRNALNLIDGHKGTGKSSVMATIAATLCTGKKLPESKSIGAKGSCLWFGSEEHFGGPVVARWKANGGTAASIHTIADNAGNGSGRLIMPYQEDRLREIIFRTRARCVVIDPYTALGDLSLDTRHEQSSRLYLESLARVAHEEHVTVLISRHMRKGRSGSLLEHGLGSVAISAVC